MGDRQDREIEIGLLGPVEVRVDGELAELPRRQQRLILAVLALEPGKVVLTARLRGLLWPDPDAEPDTAKAILQNRIGGLRRVLGDSAVRGYEAGEGYSLAIPPESVDAVRFRSLVEAARRALNAPARIAALGDAEALWRGPALFGAAPDESTRLRLGTGLEVARVVAKEDRFEAMLSLGPTPMLLEELDRYTEAHPERERAARLYVSALHRSGLTAPALEWAKAYRARLRSEFGLDTSREFRLLEQAILDPEAGEPERPTSTAHPATPAQLPPRAVTFGGRDTELARLEPAPRLVTITGPAGVGKTAFALHWAHLMADRFPDGRLYVDLRGHSEAPTRTPFEAIVELLNGIGLEPAPGADLDRAGALWRSATTNRRLLILLDNAIGRDQVAPLLPGGEGCCTVVTSRHRLTGLVAHHDAATISLSTLATADALDLVVRLLGPARHESPREMEELVEVCGGLPLALRIAVAHLLENPHRTLSSYLAAVRSDPLSTLSIEGDEESAVAGAFDLSYREMDPNDQRIFRLLGVVPGTDIDAHGVAAIAGIPVDEAVGRLRRLASAHLVETRGSAGEDERRQRYALHDLMRAYARTLSPDDEAETGLERLATWYYLGASRASDIVHPKTLEFKAPPDQLEAVRPPALESVEDAIGWSGREHTPIVATVAALAERPTPAHDRWAILLGLAHLRYCSRKGPFGDAMTIAQTAVDAARRADDHVAAAHSLLSLANVQTSIGHRVALGTLREALAEAEKTIDRPLRVGCLVKVADTLRILGDLDEAERHALRAIELTPGGTPDPLFDHGIGDVLAVLAELRGDLARADELFARAIAGFERGGSKGPQGWAMTSRAIVKAELGHPAEALALLDAAVDLAQTVGNHRVELFAVSERALLYSDLGRYDDARAEAAAALEAAEVLGHLTARSRSRLALGRALAGLDEPIEAYAVLQGALADSRAAGERRLEIQSLIHAAESAVLAGATGIDSGVGLAREAVDLAAAGGYVVLEEHARRTLDRIGRTEPPGPASRTGRPDRTSRTPP